MKVWQYLIKQDLFENKAYLDRMAKIRPEKVRKLMIEVFKSSDLTVADIKNYYLTYKDYAGKDISTWADLMDLEIYRFTPKVIKGGGNNNPNRQLDLCDLIPFKPKVIKSHKSSG